MGQSTYNRNSRRRKKEKGIKNIFEEIKAECIKELRADMNSNADSFRKELENIRMNIEKL